ncbi:Oidioi.mRNA.OKI2018_I69.PAR.g12651.t1.cds [Oikopleura dioica]|uniref:Xylulose kinase n=1 Tax=Oikopleura dioica TaxID=34765 RepID=A0ABN7S8L7_OIKDI|nr:Oidioi.mRNA.OKI2018_I69.PAR.g12651.t1.cds [Oikopleura dioica]
MDSSTSEYCKKMESAYGGKMQLAAATGSSAYERFTIHQISKFAEENPDDYKNTERISLISSFAVSLFLGDYAPIDFSDGSGMNFLRINSGNINKTDAKSYWCGVNAISMSFDSVCEKLARPVPSDTICGKIHSYWTKRYGIPENCQIVAATGDNPSSLAGLRLTPGDLCLSLGTSDTVMLSLDSAVPQPEGHIFINPLEKKKFMGLLCYKNGSLAREEIKNKYNLSWEEFGKILLEENSQDRKIIQLNFPLPEITPSNKQGKWLYEIDAAGVLKTFDGELTMREDIVSFVTGQILAKRCHVEKFGFKSTKRLIVTGGASKNRELVQIISDIFQADIFHQPETEHSAAVGAAYRAYHSTRNPPQSYEEATAKIGELEKLASPINSKAEYYNSLVKLYAKAEELSV